MWIYVLGIICTNILVIALIVLIVVNLLKKIGMNENGSNEKFKKDYNKNIIISIIAILMILILNIIFSYMFVVPLKNFFSETRSKSSIVESLINGLVLNSSTNSYDSSVTIEYNSKEYATEEELEELKENLSDWKRYYVTEVIDSEYRCYKVIIEDAN